MFAVIGTFRLPPERLVEALPLIRHVVEATLQEPGCRAYSYAEDVAEPGLFRVMEMWDSREALDAHFTTPHMRDWAERRDALGFSDRRISLFPLGVGEEL
jgi:quinol monooxygenase YgiN